MLGHTARVSACTRPAPGPHLQVSNYAVPSNGVLVVSYSCYTECGTRELPTELVVVDQTDGTAVTGSVVAPPLDTSLPDMIFWRPDEGFVEGHAYRLDFAQEPTTGLDFVGVAAMTVDLGDLERTSELQLVDSDVGDELCCTSGVLGSCEPEACITATFQRVARLYADWQHTANIAGSQVLGRVTWSTSEGADTVDDWSYARAQHEFSAQATEYCYELEVVSLIDASSTRLPRACLPHGSLDKLGVFAKSSTAFANALVGCEEAPADATQFWCAGVASACADGDSNACTAQSSECDGEGQGGQGPSTAGTGGAGAAGEPEEPDSPAAGAGSGGAPTGGSAAGGRGATTQDTGGREDSAGKDPTPAAGAGNAEHFSFADDSGCSCSVLSRGTPHRGLAALVLMMLARLCRRRPPRC
jgi:hypothetical protein